MILNRQIANPDFDDIDLALGRPNDPMGETPRNFLVVSDRSQKAERMEASDWWEPVSTYSELHLTLFMVTHEGKRALAEHLERSA